MTRGHKTMFARSFLVASIAFVAAATGSNAQAINYACPKAGTVVQNGAYTFKFTGPSVSDPFICQLGSASKVQLRLFNFYALSDRINTSEVNAPLRAAMADLLEGRKNTVTVHYTNRLGYVQTETWTFLRAEPYTVDGKTFKTIVFDHDLVADPRGTSRCHAHYVRWLDPETGIWVRSDLTVLGGQCGTYPQSYRVDAITVP
jgi:hypothetical protein